MLKYTNYFLALVLLVLAIPMIVSAASNSNVVRNSPVSLKSNIWHSSSCTLWESVTGGCHRNYNFQVSTEVYTNNYLSQLPGGTLVKCTYEVNPDNNSTTASIGATAVASVGLSKTVDSRNEWSGVEWTNDNGAATCSIKGNIVYKYSTKVFARNVAFTNAHGVVVKSTSSVYSY